MRDVTGNCLLEIKKHDILLLYFCNPFLKNSLFIPYLIEKVSEGRQLCCMHKYRENEADISGLFECTGLYPVLTGEIHMSRE